MPERNRKSVPTITLDERMAALEATDVEVADLIGRDPEQVAEWRSGDAEPDAEARVLLRAFLADDDTAARAALNRLRSVVTRDLRGDGATYAGIENAPPYGGGHTGTTGGRPE